jgi:hypothetical protein
MRKSREGEHRSQIRAPVQWPTVPARRLNNHPLNSHGQNFTPVLRQPQSLSKKIPTWIVKR